MTIEQAVPAAVPLAEARAHLRLASGGDDAEVARWIGAATAQCEAFTGLALVERDIVETLNISGGDITGGWQRLSALPVRAVTLVQGVPAEGAVFALPINAYAVDIAPDGCGLVRVFRPGAAGRVRVSYRAGWAASAETVPEALRQGMLMLCAQLARARDGEVVATCATAEMLGRAWRRMRLR